MGYPLWATENLIDGVSERRSPQTLATLLLIVLPWAQVVPWQTNILICFTSGRDLTCIIADLRPAKGPSWSISFRAICISVYNADEACACMAQSFQMYCVNSI